MTSCDEITSLKNMRIDYLSGHDRILYTKGPRFNYSSGGLRFCVAFLSNWTHMLGHYRRQLSSTHFPTHHSYCI
jgi:hypothetical protein